MTFLLRQTIFAGALLLLSAAGAWAQRGARLECPGPVRHGAYAPAARIHVEASAGLTRPVLYRNAAGSAGEHYSFGARLSPFVAVAGYVPLRERLELFAGVDLSQTWQGLRFRYTDGSGTLLVANSYAGSLRAALPLGLRYQASPWLRLSAGPYLVYIWHAGAGEATQLGAVRYTYDAPDDGRRFNGGLRLAADVQVTRRLGLVLSGAADAGQSTPSYSTAAMRDGSGTVHAGAMEPHLLHAGLALRYRLGALDE